MFTMTTDKRITKTDNVENTPYSTGGTHVYQQVAAAPVPECMLSLRPTTARYTTSNRSVCVCVCI